MNCAFLMEESQGVAVLPSDFEFAIPIISGPHSDTIKHAHSQLY